MNSPQQDAAAKVALVLITAALLLGAVGLLGVGLAVGVNPLVEQGAGKAAGRGEIQTPQPSHGGDHTVLTRSEGCPPGTPGGLSNKRQSEIRTVGFVLSVRPHGGAVTRGGFLLSGDIRPYYGGVKPHLVLCRLRN